MPLLSAAARAPAAIDRRYEAPKLLLLRSLMRWRQRQIRTDKKLSYRRGTARCALSVVILPVATQQCRNYLYDKS